MNEKIKKLSLGNLFWKPWAETPEKEKFLNFHLLKKAGAGDTSRYYSLKNLNSDVWPSIWWQGDIDHGRL